MKAGSAKRAVGFFYGRKSGTIHPPRLKKIIVDLEIYKRKSGTYIHVDLEIYKRKSGTIHPPRPHFSPHPILPRGEGVIIPVLLLLSAHDDEDDMIDKILLDAALLFRE